MFKRYKNKVLSAILFGAILLWVLNLTRAATPNPGHSWTTVGDGTFIVSGPSVMRSYVFPDASTSVLTTSTLVTVPQGGTGTSSLTGVLVANGTNAFTATTSPVGLLVGDSASLSLSNKTINLTDNSIQSNATATSTQLLRYDGTRFSAFATTTPLSFLLTNAAGTDIQWQALSTGPTGSDRQIQYNNNSAWGATSSLTMASNDILGIDNMLTFNNISLPAAANTGKLRLFSRNVASREMIQFRSDSAGGEYSVIQPNIYNNYFAVSRPNTTTSVLAHGSAFRTSVSSTNVSQSWGLATRMSYTTTVRYITNTAAHYYRGSVAGRNGFFFFSRIYTSDATAYTNSWIYLGMLGGLTSAGCSGGATTLDRAGFRYYFANDAGNWQINTNNNTTNTVVSSGMAIAISKLYDFYLYQPPQGATLYWRIDNITDGTTVSGSTGTTLPTASTALAATVCADRSNNVATLLDVVTIYVEVPR